MEMGLDVLDTWHDSKSNIIKIGPGFGWGLILKSGPIVLISSSLVFSYLLNISWL